MNVFCLFCFVLNFSAKETESIQAVTVPLGALLAEEAWHQLLPCGQHGRRVFVDSCRNKLLNSHACTISWCQKWDVLRVTVQDSNSKLLHVQTTLQVTLVDEFTIPSIE